MGAAFMVFCCNRRPSPAFGTLFRNRAKAYNAGNPQKTAVLSKLDALAGITSFRRTTDNRSKATRSWATDYK